MSNNLSCDDRHKNKIYNKLRPYIKSWEDDYLWWRPCSSNRMTKDEENQREEICHQVRRNMILSGVKKEEAKAVTSCDVTELTFWHKYLGWFIGIVLFVIGFFLIIYILIFHSIK